ncbi:MAG: hypothetical protein JXR73_06700 [Candidatus Omnitrophica bacterium]|nr:hypothetical protein [Candidatus Omnitrophota bacterium]
MPTYAESAGKEITTLNITTQNPPPEWAFWQRYILENLYPAAREFVETYTRPDGTLIWRKEWPGMDGSDDGYESFYNFPLYYVLGGPDEIHGLSRTLWESVTRQFTNYGQIHHEFDAHYDWMHHGEAYTNFYFFGLADPFNEKFRERAIRFAGLYLNEDPEDQNYDFEKKLMRSPITGSKGPHFINTAEDWITHRPILANYSLPYPDIPNVESSLAWNDDSKFPYILQTMNDRMMRGDVPLNLTATSLMLNAYMYTGDEKYKQWIEEYAAAWIQRVKKNNGILPDNIGLSGKIGEYMNGKWWGGYYGWQWPHGLFNQLESTLIGGVNAYLVSGDSSYLELPRSVFQLVESQAQIVNNRLMLPHKHGDDGWYDYRPINAKYPIHLWYASRTDNDWERIHRLCNTAEWNKLNYRKGKGDSENPEAWLGFLEGKNPEYPVHILKAGWLETLRRLELVRHDQTTPDEQDVHHWQQRNPVVLEGLVQTMLGAPNHIYHGGVLHCSVRYFDPQRMRPGIPQDTAVLIDKITQDGISLHLVNLHPVESRKIIIQAGAFGEHTITMVRQVQEYPYQFNTINHRYFQVNLAPCAAGRLEITIKRYINQPTYDFPWH